MQLLPVIFGLYMLFLLKRISLHVLQQSSFLN